MSRQPTAAQLRLLRWCDDGAVPDRLIARATVDACYRRDWIAFAGEEPYLTAEGERVLAEDAGRAELAAHDPNLTRKEMA